jgi:hypothetical protein
LIPAAIEDEPPRDRNKHLAVVHKQNSEKDHNQKKLEY